MYLRTLFVAIYNKATFLLNFLRVRSLYPFKPLRVVVGASRIGPKGWMRTEQSYLNLLNKQDWQSLFGQSRIDAVLAEHVWEHLSPEEGKIAAAMVYSYLKPGGYLRIAVPDGNHPDPSYINYVRPRGVGPGAGDHKVLYTYDTLRSLLESVGFRVVLLEYFDEQGQFHKQPWSPADGMTLRSADHDPRNTESDLNYTSLLMDAFRESANPNTSIYKTSLKRD